MARIAFSRIETWMQEQNLRPVDAARLFNVSTQTFNNWKARGFLSSTASDRVEPIIRPQGAPVETGEHSVIDRYELLASLPVKLTQASAQTRAAVKSLLELYATEPRMSDRAVEAIEILLAPAP